MEYWRKLLERIRIISKDSFKADNELEEKVTYVVLQQLGVAAGDVSKLFVKCLFLLVKKFM